MRLCLLSALLYLLLPLAGAAQPVPPDVSQWLDSNHIRYHVKSESAGLFGYFGVWADRTTTIWDSTARCYRSPVMDILRYPAIAASPYRVVRVRHIGPPGYRLGYNFDRDSGPRIAAKIDSLVQKRPLERLMELRYDEQGRLTDKKSWRNDADTTFGKKDSTESKFFSTYTDHFTYQRTPEGYTAITWYRLQDNEMLQLGSWQRANYISKDTCCGTISKLPFRQRADRILHYELNDKGWMMREWAETARYVNSCRVDPCQVPWPQIPGVTCYTYDKQGRVLTAVLSTAGRKDILLERHTYIDRPLDYSYRPMQPPLMQQYLGTIKNPVMTREYAETYSYDTRIPAGTDTVKPVIYQKSTVVVTDAGGERMRFDPAEENTVVEVSSRAKDAEGPYRSRVRLYQVNKNNDDAVYDPRRSRESYTLTGGDYHPTIWKLPPGTFGTNSIDFSDRVALPASEGWRLICYGNDEPGINTESVWEQPEDFWAPQIIKRYYNSATYRNNFVLLDSKGLVRYVYDDGNVYRLEYE